jgi:GT2 family glycosyltransferase
VHPARRGETSRTGYLHTGRLDSDGAAQLECCDHYAGVVPTLGWVVLTTGDRPVALRRAVQSVLNQGDVEQVVVFANGCAPEEVRISLPATAGLIVGGSDVNLGVPGGRDAALGLLDASVGLVGFLDDDAELLSDGVVNTLEDLFDEADVAAVSMRLVDEEGHSARRHVPRLGKRSADERGDVATFLGGASVLRRSAYREAGGYWADLFYGHEELDLAWRLADRGYRVVYEPALRVFHPHSEISRHADGWRLTGRNRVRVARRNLPWPIVPIHVGIWLFAGVRRAPAGCRRAYFEGWVEGWRGTVPRQAMQWSTMMTLTRRGRCPVI